MLLRHPLFVGDTLGCFKKTGLEALSLKPRVQGGPAAPDRRWVAWVSGVGGVSVPSGLCFGGEAGTSPGPPHQPRGSSAHLPANTDPTGPGNGPWARMMFEKGTDHLDDKWASGHCQRVRVGETISSHTEAAASVMPESAGGSPLLCLLLLNVVLFTHN